MLEILAIIAGAVLILTLIAYTSRKTSGLNPNYFRGKWSEIEKTHGTSKTGQRLSVIDADALFDHALKQLSFRGDSMGERLRSAEPSIKNYQAVWAAHKLRNRLVHEPDVKLTNNETSRALKSFKVALKNLGAL